MQSHPFVIAVCSRDYTARDIYLFFKSTTKPRFSVSPFRLSRLCLASLVSLLISRIAQPDILYSGVYMLVYSRTRSCAYERHVTTLVPGFDGTSRDETNPSHLNTTMSRKPSTYIYFSLNSETPFSLIRSSEVKEYNKHRTVSTCSNSFTCI